MDKIIYNISSYNRLNSLIKTIDSIYHQSDIINVVLNNYDEIPIELYDKKINLLIGDNEKGDAYKFYPLNNSKGYYFTIDDDLIYDSNYSNHLIDKIEEFERKKIVTLHGRNFDKFPIKSYYSDKSFLSHFRDSQKKDIKVQFGGTGVMAFHTDLLKINMDYFKLPNMADVWVGKYAKENNIDIISVKRNKSMVIQQSIDESIYDNYLTDDTHQTIIVNQIFEIPEISIIIPTYNNELFIDQSIESIIKSCGDIKYEILVGIDNCEKTLDHIKNKNYNQFIRFFYFNKNIGPYIIRNTLSKLSKTNNILLFFDSDDVAKENMINDIMLEFNNFDCVRPMYHNFSGELNVNNVKFNKHSGLWGEGVFAIKKDIFIHFNGFEPWFCAADTDFMVRLYKNNIKIKLTNILMFYRRLHDKGLTSQSSTGYGSQLRKEYSEIINAKTYFGPLPEMFTEDYVEVQTGFPTSNEILNKMVIIEKQPIKLIPKDFNPNRPRKVVNSLMFAPEKKPTPQNKPKERNEIFEIKKGSLADLSRKIDTGKGKKAPNKLYL